jgi:RHS repeat-associated protein
LITEAQGASILAYYTQGSGLISQRRNNASYFYHYDGLGSTKALTDANQNIQNTTKYDAWGNILQSSGTITNPYLYVGELGYYSDGDAGMYLLTQRWYNPLIGRFVVRDPLSRREENFSTEGVYLYVRNLSTGLTDPLGLISSDFCRKWRDKCFEEAEKEFGKCVIEVAFGSWKEAVGEEVLLDLISCVGICWTFVCPETGPAFFHCVSACSKVCEVEVAGIKYAFAYAACKWILYKQKKECDEAYNWCCVVARRGKPKYGPREHL